MKAEKGDTKIKTDAYYHIIEFISHASSCWVKAEIKLIENNLKRFCFNDEMRIKHLISEKENINYNCEDDRGLISFIKNEGLTDKQIEEFSKTGEIALTNKIEDMTNKIKHSAFTKHIESLIKSLKRL